MSDVRPWWRKKRWLIPGGFLLLSGLGNLLPEENAEPDRVGAQAEVWDDPSTTVAPTSEPSTTAAPATTEAPTTTQAPTTTELTLSEEDERYIEELAFGVAWADFDEEQRELTCGLVAQGAGRFLAEKFAEGYNQTGENFITVARAEELLEAECAKR